ncbi:MAG: hypothetical protein AAF514_19500, partial [Verrucomicrobiota bacterium]
FTFTTPRQSGRRTISIVNSVEKKTNPEVLTRTAHPDFETHGPAAKRDQSKAFQPRPLPFHISATTAAMASFRNQAAFL